MNAPTRIPAERPDPAFDIHYDPDADADDAPRQYDPVTLDYAIVHELEPGVPDAQRYDGWTPEKQKRFLTALARGHNISTACDIVGLSRQSAYALRSSAKGAAFALGWGAAVLRARDVLADDLMDRVSIPAKPPTDSGVIPPTRFSRCGNAHSGMMPPTLWRPDRRGCDS